MGWNGKLFEEVSQFITRFFISMKFRERETQSSFSVSSVYRPNDRSLKPLFLQNSALYTLGVCRRFGP